MNRSTQAVLAAGIAILLISGTALAGTTTEAHSVRVSYADLDLTQEPGAARLYARLKHAAHAVCATGSEREVLAAALYQACYARALGEAVAAVGSPKLTAHYVRAASGAPLTPAA